MNLTLTLTLTRDGAGNPHPDPNPNPNPSRNPNPNPNPNKLAWEAGPHRARMDQLYKRLVQQLVAKYQKPRTMSCTAGHVL